MSTVPGADIAIRTYISSAVGVNQDSIADSCLFVPVPYEIRYNDADRAGLELVAGAKNSEDRTVGITTDIHALERAIEDVLGMLERVGEYVGRVIVCSPLPSPYYSSMNILMDGRMVKHLGLLQLGSS